MQTRCPRCKTVVRATGTDWIIINPDCSELSETKWGDQPEFCPILAQVVEPDIALPGLANRSVVQIEIDRVKATRMGRPEHR